VAGEPLFDAPLDVLVRTESARRAAPGVRPHRWTAPLLPNDVYFVQPGLYVSSPELCLVQLALRLSVVGLALAGSALVSTYALCSASPYGVVEAAPLTDLGRLSRGVSAQAGSVWGAARARDCLPFVLEGAASPVEVRLGLYFSLPRSLGGHGLPKPTLNLRYNVEGEVRRVADRSHYRGDLCWPEAGVAVEYDSDAAHTGSDRIAADTRRRNALAAMGVTVLGVTRPQLHSRSELDRVAHIVGMRLGTRGRERSPSRQDRRQRLYDELFCETAGQPLEARTSG
jgi:very-short-patch-repair endonuclease